MITMSTHTKHSQQKQLPQERLFTYFLTMHRFIIENKLSPKQYTYKRIINPQEIGWCWKLTIKN